MGVYYGEGRYTTLQTRTVTEGLHMSYSGYYRGKTASSTVLATVCEQSNEEEKPTVLSKRTQEKKKGQIATRPVVNATVEARKPKAKHTIAATDTGDHDRIERVRMVSHHELLSPLWVTLVEPTDGDILGCLKVRRGEFIEKTKAIRLLGGTKYVEFRHYDDEHTAEDMAQAFSLFARLVYASTLSILKERTPVSPTGEYRLSLKEILKPMGYEGNTLWNVRAKLRALIAKGVLYSLSVQFERGKDCSPVFEIFRLSKCKKFIDVMLTKDALMRIKDKKHMMVPVVVFKVNLHRHPNALAIYTRMCAATAKNGVARLSLKSLKPCLTIASHGERSSRIVDAIEAGCTGLVMAGALKGWCVASSNTKAEPTDGATRFRDHYDIEKQCSLIELSRWMLTIFF